MNPELKVFSVSQCVRHPPAECDFCRHFGGKDKLVAVDSSGPYANWKLGVLRGVAARPMMAGELVDGLWCIDKKRTFDKHLKVSLDR